MKRFYKKGISLFLILLMSFPLCACKSDDSKALTTVKLNEVAHSIFYAPMYVAIEKGYFEDEGIEFSPALERIKPWLPLFPGMQM